MTYDQFKIVRAALDAALLNAKTEEEQLPIFETIQTVNALYRP
jgi:hypothetical protein